MFAAFHEDPQYTSYFLQRFAWFSTCLCSALTFATLHASSYLLLAFPHTVKPLVKKSEWNWRGSQNFLKLCFVKKCPGTIEGLDFVSYLYHCFEVWRMGQPAGWKHPRWKHFSGENIPWYTHRAIRSAFAVHYLTCWIQPRGSGGWFWAIHG